MVLDTKATTLAYRCPSCGAGVMSVVDMFKLKADMVKLKCSCGQSEMSVVKSSDDKLHLTVPCLFCANPHRYTLSSAAFFTKELFVLPCHYMGVNLVMIGEANRVKAELARTELELLDMLEKSGVDSFESIRGGEETLGDPQVMDIITYVIRELDEEGKIICRCDPDAEKAYELEMLPEALRISCKHCGAKKDISAASFIAAHDFLNIDELILE